MQSVNSFGAWMGPIGPWAPVRRTVCTPVVPPLVILANVDQIHLYFLNEVVNECLTVVVPTYDANLLPASSAMP